MVKQKIKIETPNQATRAVKTAKTIQQLKAEIKDLGERLYYCSNSGEGRKVRKELGRAIHQKEQQLEQRISQCAGCIANEPVCENCEK